MKRRGTVRTACGLAGLAVAGGMASTAAAYSVLSHEAVVDSLWPTEIRRLLLQRFPSATEAEFREAHAYAYGGSIIQDLGYYPFGNRFFSDLTHYVRAGDFVAAMLADARDLDEYAFALGALSHYASDEEGHPLGVNRAVPLVYPKLQKKYGDEVTFENDPKAHVMVEFSFDVVRVAGSGYLPRTYHDFVGFQVARGVLERAFRETYGLEMSDLFDDEDLAIGTYRRAASEVIPQLTRAAWKKRKNEILKLNPQASRSGFVYKLSRREYEDEWGNNYRKPEFARWRARVRNARPALLARVLVFIFQIVPKVGPLQTLAFKVPSPEAEQLFVKSYRATLERYRSLVEEAIRGRLSLPNEDLDTGRATRLEEYALADKTYAELLDELSERGFRSVPSALREDILGFYSAPGPKVASRHDSPRWRRTERELKELQASGRTNRAERSAEGLGPDRGPGAADH
jgi:zinc dependent phospholipase C